MANKFYIFTEGGSEYGYGHIIRCSSIYEELENRGIDVKFFIFGDDEVSEVLKNKNYEILEWKNIDFIKKIRDEEINILIDSYLMDIEISNFMSRSFKKVIYIDDNNRINYSDGIVVNPSIYGELMEYTKNEKVEYLLGVKYILLRSEFLIEENKEINKELKVVLIILGGSDIKNITPRVLEILNDKFTYLKRNIVIGKGFKNEEEIRRKINSKDKLYYNLSAKQMKSLMLESDVSISACGQTIQELAKVGLATIGILIAENQRRNVEYWSENGFLDFAGDYNGDIKEKIENYLNKMLDYKYRKDKSIRGKEILKNSFGAKNIIDYIYRP